MTRKPTVVLFLQDNDQACALADLLTESEIEALVAESSDHLYRIVNYRQVDLVVLSNELGGFLSGLDILARLYQDLLRPTTLLMATLTREFQERARSMGVVNVLRHDAPLIAMRDMIQSLLATAQVSQIVIAPEARKLVQKSDFVTPLPQVLVRLCSYLEDENASLNELANDISIDPKLTSDLLKLSNGSTLGRRRKVNNVADAIGVLGVRETASLVLSKNMIQGQFKLGSQLPESVRSWFNARSVLIASTAATFAKEVEGISSEMAHLLGLMQDLGILVLAGAHGNRYLQMLHRTKDVGHLRLEIIEAQEYKITHADVSAALLHKWEMPQTLISMVLHHHSAETQSGVSDADRNFLHVMQVAESMANLSDRFTPQRHQHLCSALAALGQIPPERVKACLGESVARSLESMRLFALPIHNESKLKDTVFHFSSRTSAEDLREEPSPEEIPSGRGETEHTKPEALEQAAVARTPSPESSQSRPVVLVVDDQALSLEQVRRGIPQLGCELVLCEDANQAKSKCQGASAILCDVHLGSESGATLVREIRNMGVESPIIMMSGDCSRTTVEDCLAAGASDYLAKPFTRKKLMEKLSTHLGLSAS